MAKLYFKYGTMNSSKSAQLLMVDYNYKDQGKTTLVFKPLLDTRDGAFVKSRALGDKIGAEMVGKHEHNFMFNLTRDKLPDCVLVDEVQFMPEHQIEELARIVDHLQIPVIAFGLMVDFKSKLFPGSKRLVELGANLDEIKTVCWDCKTRAVMNMRFLDERPTFTGDQVEVGGNEMYRPVCRSCFRKAQEQGELEDRLKLKQ